MAGRKVTSKTIFWFFFFKRKTAAFGNQTCLHHGRFFSAENVSKNVLNQFHKDKPEGIIGISLVGLIAPRIAEAYPEARVVFISSGSRLCATASVFNFAFRTALFLARVGGLHLIMSLPPKTLYHLYCRIHTFTGSEEGRELYEQDARNNVAAIKRISVRKQREILQEVSSLDNTTLL